MWFINFCLSLPETFFTPGKQCQLSWFQNKETFWVCSNYHMFQWFPGYIYQVPQPNVCRSEASSTTLYPSKPQSPPRRKGCEPTKVEIAVIYILYSYVSYVYIFHIDQTFPNIQKPLPMSHPIHPFKTIEKSILNTKNFKDHWSMPPLGLFPWLCSFCKGCRWWWSITWKLWFLRRKCLPSITYPIWHPNVSKMAWNNEIQDKVMTKSGCIYIYTNNICT